MVQSLLTNLSAYVMPCAGEFFGEPPLVYGTLASVLYTASYISAPVFGVLADHLGRAPTTRLSVAILFIGSMLSALAPSFSSLLAAQAVLGVGLGGSMAPFSLLAELSPPSVRGIILSSANYFWSLGTLLVSLCAWLTIGDSDWIATARAWWPAAFWGAPWRVLVAASTIPVLGAFVLSPAVFESPHFLVARGGPIARGTCSLASRGSTVGRPPLRTARSTIVAAPLTALPAALPSARLTAPLKAPTVVRGAAPMGTLAQMTTSLERALRAPRVSTSGSRATRRSGGRRWPPLRRPLRRCGSR